MPDNVIKTKRLELEREKFRMERRKGEIESELEQLQKDCPHLNVAPVDYDEGSDSRTRDHCDDCGAEDYPGCLKKTA